MSRIKVTIPDQQIQVYGWCDGDESILYDGGKMYRQRNQISKSRLWKHFYIVLKFESSNWTSFTT
jgi:hypothetical protein